MSKDYPVSGLKQLDDFLSYLPMNLQKGAYRAGLTAAAAIVRDEARSRAPRKTGQLSRSISSGSPRQNQDGSFSITVGPRGKSHAFLGLFHEYGVRPHYITAGNAKFSTDKSRARKLTKAARAGGYSDVASQVLRINGQYVSGAILHPGFSPRPFLRPALDAKAQEAVNAFAQRIRTYIEQRTGFAPSPDTSEAA